MDEAELVKQLTDHDHRIKSLQHQMTEQKAFTKELHSLSKNMAILIEQVKNTNTNVEELKEKVDSIEKEPQERLTQIKTAIIAALASGIITAFVSAFFMAQ